MKSTSFFYSFLFLLLLCSIAPPLLAKEPDWQALSQTNAWLRLLHFHETWTGRRYSQVDEPDFFLHPKGAQDPTQELVASWQQLTKNLASESLPDEEDDLRCTYPARADFFRRHLDLAIPKRACPQLDAWQEQVSPGSLTMIFPSSYINNASSMFGHTLLRIDSQDRVRNPDLVAWAVNFAAEVDAEDGGLAYAVKGMLGRYPGYFSLMPYYEKVNEYSQMENRDIWEYPLQLSDDGLQRIIWHLWELDRVRFDYWFFDENCSYRLLALLSVAEDDLHLTEGFNLKALPVDTIRALKTAGLLIDEGQYRPAFATRVQAMAEQLSDAELSWARRLVFDQPDPDEVQLPDEVNAAAVYEFAAEWLNFRFRHQGVPRQQAAPQLHRLLVARSRIEEPAGLVPPELPDAAPHQGHKTARWGLGAGYHEDLGYLALVARPAYHSRFDAVEGYLPNAEINLLELEVRFYEEEQRLEPWHLTLLEVGNYLRSSPIFSLPAWRVQAEIGRTQPEGSVGDAWRSRLGGGYGRAWGDSRELMIYAFAAADLEAGPAAGHLDTTAEDDWALGPGLNLGGVWAPVQPLRLGLDARWTRFVQGNSGDSSWIEATAQWNFAAQQSLQVQAEWDDRGEETWQAGIRWLRFF